MTELKPCPHCGNDAVIYNTNTVFIECKDCHTSGPYRRTMKDAIEAWNGPTSTLRWTKEPPTDPGYYWHEEDHEKQPVYVFRGAPLHGKTTLYAQFFGEGDVVHKVSGMSGKWAGPIQEPVK